MITKNSKSEPQMQIISIDQLVPEDHLLRKIDETIDFSFIYDLVEEKYSPDSGRPSIDPVSLIKMPMIQYLFGIPSMRRTVEEIEVNVAYRWFLGLDFYDKVPHFSTFGKNYKRRFEGTDLFEQIFSKILLQCMREGLVDTQTIFAIHPMSFAFEYVCLVNISVRMCALQRVHYKATLFVETVSVVGSIVRSTPYHIRSIQ